MDASQDKHDLGMQQAGRKQRCRYNVKRQAQHAMHAAAGAWTPPSISALNSLGREATQGGHRGKGGSAPGRRLRRSGPGT